MKSKARREKPEPRGRKATAAAPAPTRVVAAVLVLLTFAAFLPTLGHPFVNYDDQLYVFENPEVQAGLSAHGIGWALTTQRTGNWHPLTWLSLMLDHQLFGLHPSGYHWTNLLLHLASVALLLYVLVRMTGSLWRSAFVAALFALHPQRVESVAWVAERKDVLSTLFWMLTLWAYLRYADKPGWSRYWPALLFYALGLMAKPMLVSMPFVLLLLDFWPLRRFVFSPGPESAGRPALTTRPTGGLLLEKLPFLALAIVSSVLTVLAQLSSTVRLAGAVVAYSRYIGKMLWPAHLAVLYPHPGSVPPVWQAAGSLAVLLIGTGLVWKGRARGYPVTGWLWFLITLVPVIGIVQVGSASMADRYTYVTHLGLYLIIAWGVPDLLGVRSAAAGGSGRTARILTVGGAAVVLACAVCTWVQAGVWKDSVTLWAHAVTVTKHNYLAHENLAKAFYVENRLEEAEREYREALRIKPDEPGFWTNLGIVLGQRGKLDEAVECHTKALALDPRLAQAYSNRALLYVRLQKPEAALADYQQLLTLLPENVNARYNLGLTLASLGRMDEAAEEFRRVLSVRPDYDRARSMLERIAQAKQPAGPDAGQPEEAP
jgi:Flp pilus assembly protein TadD